jgi:hypothetical protein
MSQVDGDVLQKRTEKLADHINQQIYDQRKSLLGRVLTIVESALPDPEQRKATKDLVHTVFYSESYWEGPRIQFEMFAEANGFKIFQGGDLPPSAQPANPYNEVK